MRLRCVVLDDFQGVATRMADWSVIEDEVEVVALREHLDGEDALATALADYDIVVTLRERVPFPASLFARLPRLRLLIASGMRNSVIDHAAAEAHGVTVCGTASSGTPPVELTWALLLGLARGIVEESDALRAGGPWQSTVGADLHGSRLGLLGLGRIGSRVAQVGLAFGMRVSAWSHHLTKERATENGVELAASKEELLTDSDFVSVHLALGERTRGLVGAPELALMKPTAYLVNTSRAAIVDQDALLATPHLGYVSRANYTTYYGQAVENIQAYLAGSPVRRLP
ncbi:D-2-hydroxyacid dehydrogenase family protein [Streptomyces sp. NPDC048362]|uniref:D-2-hydroxyacid dehydrogenase family protein n=1 Tax=Streptomyces sp. NPDC048362 TaxID=3365539 RepID=UPI003713B2DA